MSVIRLTEAPIKDNIVDDTGALPKVWLQYFGDLQDSSRGYWGDALNVITAVNCETSINRLELQGKIVHLYLKFNDPSFSLSTVSFPKKYSVLDAIVQLNEVNSAGVIISTTQLFVKDSTIKLPDLVTTNDVYLTGTLILNLKQEN